VPYLAGTVLLEATSLGFARHLGRGTGVALLGLYASYRLLNLWRELR